jgi:hypothetical protein
MGVESKGFAMNRQKIIITILMIISLLLIACGGTKKAESTLDPGKYLAQKFASGDIVRTSDIDRYVGDSLYEYIDGGAEVYHSYKFNEAVTATYKYSEAEIVADIYSFKNADMAYGMYSTLRPESPKIVSLGVEGFTFGSSLDFVKGNFIVRLTGYDDTPETEIAINILSAELNNSVAGKTSKPEMFLLFPPDNKIEYTEKIYAESFLGRQPLTDVYTTDYRIQGDTATLFISNDENGDKFQQWLESIKLSEASMKMSKSLPYDQPKSFITEDSYYGTIVAGVKKGKLLGIIGYKDSQKEFLINWLNTFN